MWVVDCDRCHRRRLVGVRRVRALQNIAPGVIAVQVACPCGHLVTMLTGGGRPPVQVRQ